MREEKLNFGIIIRMLVSLLPILFGMPTIAVLLCAYNIAMSFVVFGPLTCFVSSLSAVCISMFLCGTYGEAAKIMGLFLGLEAVLCAAGCLYSVVKKKNFYTGVWISALGYLIPYFSYMRITASKQGLSVAQFVSNSVVEAFRTESQILLEESPQVIDEALVLKLEKFLSVITGVLVPAVMIIISVIIGYILMHVICARLRRAEFPVNHTFSEIKIPRIMIIVFAISAGLIYADFNQYVTAVALNVCVIFAVMCFFAGISFVDFYLRKAGKGTVARVLIHFLIFMLSSGTVSTSPWLNIFTAYILLAAIDSFANIRKLSKTELKGAESGETENREN